MQFGLLHFSPPRRSPIIATLCVLLRSVYMKLTSLYLYAHKAYPQQQKLANWKAQSQTAQSYHKSGRRKVCTVLQSPYNFQLLTCIQFTFHIFHEKFFLCCQGEVFQSMVDALTCLVYNYYSTRKAKKKKVASCEFFFSSTAMSQLSNLHYRECFLIENYGTIKTEEKYTYEH